LALPLYLQEKAATAFPAQAEVWHKRLGHMSYHNLETQKKATSGMEKLTSDEIKTHIQDCTC